MAILLQLWTVGGCGFLEHPEEASWRPEAPSSWKLMETQWIQQLPGIDTVAFDQCTMQAETRKPTRILTVNFADARRLLDQEHGGGVCRHGQRGHKPLIGVDENGAFRTAPAKQYPSDMCRFLAKLIVGRISKVLSQPKNMHEFYMPEEIANFHTPLDPYDKDQVFGAYGMDYMHASRTAMNMTIPSGRAEDGQAQPASSHDDLPTDENYDQMQSCTGLDDSQGQWSFADDDEPVAEPAPVEVDYGMPDGVIDGRCRGSSGDSPSLQAGVRAHSEDLGGWRWTSDGNC